MGKYGPRILTSIIQIRIDNLPRPLIPFAVSYDFDGTLAPGNMQERDFIQLLE
jgi:hypothetical protein